MKIKSISCTQFAGVRDRSVSFTGGVNVIYGKNESGKSTLVNLLSRTLFQKARLDRRTDKDFCDLYFPSANRGSNIAGDFVDGKVTFETESGVYTLTKEWGDDSRCVLSTPDGVISDQSRIDELLKKLLLYGEGVYSDMLFSSQRNTALSLQTILDNSEKNASTVKRDITDAVSRAFAESDGVSVDAVEQAIKARIEEIAGKHWDLDREAPIRKAGGRWVNSLGNILRAYYAWEDAKDVLQEITRLENEADRAASDYAERDAAARKAEEAYDRFHVFAGRLALQSERKKAIVRMNEELSKISKVLSSWPELTEALKRARALLAEKEDRELLDRYGDAKKLHDELAAINESAANRPGPSEAEIKQVRNAQNGVASLENKLCGMNLNAAIRMLNGSRVEITSLRTGEAVEISGGAASISEAVRITIPGVMEMQLSPTDVDVAAVEGRIAEQKAAISGIFAKYGAESLEELEQLAKDIADANTRTDIAKNSLAMLLGGTAYGELEAAAGAVTGDIRSKEEIERDIIAVCGSAAVEKFITAKETVIAGYEADYGGINALQDKVSKKGAELKNARESVSADGDIPAEYLSISDPDAYLKALRDDSEEKRSRREAALAEKAAAVSRRDSYQEKIPGDPVEDAEQAKRNFEEQKSLLAHWKHIEKVFKARKDAMQNEPMRDIADSFAHYLGVISGGKVSSEFPKADKLNMNIYSGNRHLDYGKLSEGTRDTVSLAFRLAVLDHLFPQGGGVVVFDDPFTDMDADRMAQSCELIKECAKRHQVIFLTCREDYLSMLNGNNIFF